MGASRVFAGAPFFLPRHDTGKSEELVRLNCRGVSTGWGGGRIGIAVGLLLAGGAALLGLALARPMAAVRSQNALSPAVSQQPSTTLSGAQPVHLAYARLPLGFEANQGQSDARVKFLARGSGYGLFLTEEEAVLVLQSAGKDSSVVRMHLAGADPTARVDWN